MLAAGDPEEMARLARVLRDGAADLRRLLPRLDAALTAAGRPTMPVLVPLARTAAWAESEAADVRRRARQLAADDRRSDDRYRPPPFAGGQHGRQRLRLTDEAAQLERARRAASAPQAGREARAERDKLEKKQGKFTGERRSRQRKDAKPSPAEKAAVRRERDARKRDAANRAGTLTAVALGVWWAGKLLSPACGPAAPVCAAVL